MLPEGRSFRKSIPHLDEGRKVSSHGLTLKEFSRKAAKPTKANYQVNLGAFASWRETCSVWACQGQV